MSKQNLLKKATTRRLMKIKPKISNENKSNINIIKDPKFGIMSKKAIVKNIECI
jgi:hypothetical protein